MRTVTYGAAASLDGYIARPDGAVDWLHWSDDVGAIMKEFWKGIDTILMGRKTWEVSVAMGGGGGMMKGMRGYLFSRTMSESPEGMELVSEDAGAFVRRLKEQDGKGICMMGGGELARSFFEADVIDEVGANVHPVLLGTGIPLFPPMQRQVNLEMIENRSLAGGCAYLRYRVVR
ncbi:MAG TPA: dihydrofolate reductase family protein [Longimicrobium sp.]|nr:dihydrofolate reductase family protein [Longimicrobium sp.]